MRSRRALSSGVSLALLLGLCTATASSTATATAVTEPPPGGESAERAERLLRADAVDPVQVSTGPDGIASFVGALGEPVAGEAVPPAATPVEAATEHLGRYGALFDVERPRAQLDPTAVVDGPSGSHVVRFEQQVDGLPVVGGEIAVSVARDGGLQSVNGETTDPEAVVPAPSEPAVEAVRTAITTTARAHGVRARTLTPSPAQRWFYDPELIGSPDPFGPRPVWRVEVSNGAEIRQLVLVDTATGAVVESANQVAHALNRVVCDRERASSSLTRRCAAGNSARRERDGAVGDADVDAAFDFAGHTSLLYETLGTDLTRLIGYNAGDGARRLRLTVDLRGNNAAWNGREAYFSRGWATDDVVAHELTHGVIQHTSNLFYWYQSGAINESMADVFGEIVDQRNGLGSDGQGQQWLLGEDTRVGAIRNMRNPRAFISAGQPRQPDRMRSRFYFADRFLQDGGGVHINSGVGNKAAFLVAAGGRFNGQRVRGLDMGQTDRRETARIYFRALQMLTSGSDYADLGRVLPQACRALAGTGTGGDRITARDCRQVRRAVVATEMHLQPKRATAPEAPRCTPRNAASRRLFFDDAERNRRRTWAMGRLWSRIRGYATSGTDSIHGLNPGGRTRHSVLTLRRNIQVPARSRTRTYLRFDHSHLFEHNFRTGTRARYIDGGRLEYSTNRGRTWANAASLGWVNGPDEAITLGTRRTRFRGFGGDSHGYQSSRLNLSQFRGRTVRLRWAVSGDRFNRGFGWLLDDVEVYTCRRR